MKIRKHQLSKVAMVAAALTATACGQQQQPASRLLDDPAPSTPASQAAADISIDASQYFQARESAKTAPQIDDELLAKFPASCEEGAEPDPASDSVAMMVEGQCKVVSKADARAKLAELGQAMALYGADIAAKIDSAQELPSASSEAQGEVVADPKVDLGQVVAMQINLSNVTDPNAPQFALDGYALNDHRWGGAMAERTYGSNQFGLTAAAHMYVTSQEGIGIDGALRTGGKVFGETISIINGTLTGSGLNGERASVSADVRLLGTSILNRQLQEPEWQGAGSLASINRSYGGTIRFSLGPVPFGVNWSVSLNGDVPWAITARVTNVRATLTPNLRSGASLSGGPNIVVASAGVGGSFTLVNATLSNSAEASVQVRESVPNMCYKVSSALNFSNMLGGRLYAFAEIGWPNRTAFGRPLGWRGDLNFVNWDGQSLNIPIYSSGTEITCAAIGS